MPRYYGDERERSRDRDRERDRDRDRDRDRERARRSPTYDPDNGEEGREEPSVTSWIPSAGIDYEVIRHDLPLFLGPKASVERGKLANDSRPGYIVRGPFTLTVAMIADLKRDTIDWEEERPRTSNKDYRKSKTCNFRQARGASRPLASVQSAMAHPPQRTDSMAIPASQHDRSDETRAPFADASPQPAAPFLDNYPPERTSSRYQAPAQGGYNEPPRASDTYARNEPPGVTAPGPGRGPPTNLSFSSNAHTQNMGQPRNPAVPAPPAPTPPTYTRADVARRVAQKLKDDGHSKIAREDFERAVDDAFRRIQQQQAPPPYSKTSSTQPDTTGTRGFSAPTATAGPKPDPGYGQYQY